MTAAVAPSGRVPASRTPLAAPSADDVSWADESARGLGVYVHVPFCARRCGYCDFAAFDGLEDLTHEYVERVRGEIRERVDVPAATVFVGGGTPSLLPPELLRALIDEVPVETGAEVTVEMNPESASPAVIEAAAAAGANRISMGMQSANARVLDFLDRAHSPGCVAAAVAAARTAGFDELNLDLIYGTPGETAADWAQTLDAAIALGPSHVSAYALTVEPATSLGRAVALGVASEPDDDECADRLAQTAEVLTEAGFVRYEISNWSRSRPCVHNLRYWSGGAYVGVGCGAHSYDPSARRRSWNVRHPRTYVDAANPCQGGEILGQDELRDEQLMLGLRRACGLPAGNVSASPAAIRRRADAWLLESV